MFIVTMKWLDSHRTSAGAYNNPQVLSLGWVDGLKTPDWKKRSVGLEISECQRKLFESLTTYKQDNDKPQKKKKISAQEDARASAEASAEASVEALQRQAVVAECRKQQIEAPW